MADETVSTGTTQTTETPSYSPPDNEPQGLEPNKVEASPTEGKTKASGDTDSTSVKDDSSKVVLPKSIKPPVKTGRFQERISDLVSQRDLSKREADQLREELAKIKTSSTTQPNGSTTQGKQGSALNPEDFPTYGDYVSALIKQSIDEKAQSIQSQRAQEEQARHKQERSQAFNTHAAPLAQQYGDGFWDTITDPTLPVTEVMADAVMELDNLGPYTMLYLATHRDEAAKIAAMNPRAATIAIGRLAAQIDQELKSGNTQTSESVSSASNTVAQPRPTAVPTPRGASPGLANGMPSDKDSVDEWLRKETLRLRSRNPHAQFYGSR